MSSILIACDGSSLRKPDGTVGGPIGWAWAREDEAWQSSGFYVGTNQRAELNALLSVLIFHPTQKLTIQMDSKYALNTAESWMWGWAKKGWTKADGEPVSNLDIIQHIHALMTARPSSAKIDFQWVKGHLKDNSFPLNTAADFHAGEASKRAKLEAVDPHTSLSLYRDSKGRTFHEREFEIMSKIANVV